jgi:hypothetical protein
MTGGNVFVTSEELPVISRAVWHRCGQ